MSSLRTFITLMMAVAALYAAGQAANSESLGALLTDTNLRPSPAITATDASIVRSRFAQVDRVLLESLSKGNRIELNLFPDKSYMAVVEGVNHRVNGRASYFLTLPGRPYASAVIVVEGSAVLGSVSLPSESRVIEILAVGDEHQVVKEIDANLIPPCSGSVTPEAAQDLDSLPKETGLDRYCVPEHFHQFDVMIVYTPAARAACGGTDGINAYAQLAVDLANIAFDNSDLSCHMTLVRCQEIDYDEAGTFDDHLRRLTRTNDGVMDNVHNRRYLVGADFVSLFVDDSDDGQVGGIGWCGADQSHAFSVVNWSSVRGHTFVHEIGHNLGCAHDSENDNGCGYYSYSFGWRFMGGSGTLWRTIMAYRPGSRINYFSNPDVSFDGVPTGMPIGETNEANNVRTIKNRDFTCENFLNTRFAVWVDFDWTSTQYGTWWGPIRDLQTGLSRVYPGSGPGGLPTLWVKDGSIGGAWSVSKPMVIRACGGPVVIGGQ